MLKKPQVAHAFMSVRRGKVAAVLAGVLVAFHMLFPLDRGFPAPVIIGKPVSYAILASIGLLLVFAIASPRAVVFALSSRYCAIMAAFVAVLVQSSLRAPGALAMTAMHSTAVFFCVFIVNYALFRYVIACGGRTILVRAAVVTSFAAASIGIAQSIFGLTIPAYADWYFNYHQTPMPDASLATVRANGTLNQPILFGTALMMSAPFVLELRSRFLRYLAVAIICTAAVLTGSRTILIVGTVFAVGSMMVYRVRSFVKPAVLVVAALLVVQTVDVGLDLQSAARVPFLLSRLGVGSDAIAASALDNVQVRQTASSIAIDEMLGESDPVMAMFGRGRTTASDVGAQVARSYSTVDNAFVTVLYEDGIIGLLLFCAAFAAFLYDSRGAARKTLHWYSAVALLSVGISFDFEAYSTVNILVAASMALASTSLTSAVGATRRVVMRSSVLTADRPAVARPVPQIG